MSEFKSRLIGGYRKKDVDQKIQEYINENNELKAAQKLLQIQLNEANADLKALRETDSANSEDHSFDEEISNLQRENADLKAECGQLKKQLEEQKQLSQFDAANSSQMMNIGKIYLHAYESGSMVANEAKNQTNDYFNKINSVANEGKQSVKTAIEKYEAVRREMQLLLSRIVNCVNEVSDQSEDLIEKANAISDTFDEIESAKSSAESKAQEIINEYERYTAVFMTENEEPKPTTAFDTATITTILPVKNANAEQENHSAESAIQTQDTQAKHTQDEPSDHFPQEQALRTTLLKYSKIEK